ncbi:MAG TPA: hypothetical protein VGN07_04640 [Steroidobacteraceae bacterium]|jgi:hypothetical protein
MLTASAHQSTPSHTDILDAHSNFLMAARYLYLPNVVWHAPSRDIRRVGREEVIRHLLREAGGMQDPDHTFLHRNSNERQIIDEFAVRFVYAGEGIDRAPVAAGDLVELKRVRILELHGNKVAAETCVENWTVIRPAS